MSDQMVGLVALVALFRALLPPSLTLFVRGSPYSTAALTFLISAFMGCVPWTIQPSVLKVFDVL